MALNRLYIQYRRSKKVENCIYSKGHQNQSDKFKDSEQQAMSRICLVNFRNMFCQERSIGLLVNRTVTHNQRDQGNERNIIGLGTLESLSCLAD